MDLWGGGGKRVRDRDNDNFLSLIDLIKMMRLI